MSITEAGPDF